MRALLIAFGALLGWWSTAIAVPVDAGADLTFRREVAKQTAIHLARNPRGMSNTVASIGCPQSQGGLSLVSSLSRVNGISPLTVWVDNTATTDSNTLGGANTVPQDVYFAMNYGDTGASGTGTWQYGDNGTAQGGTGNSKNLSTGIAGMHMYVVPPGSGDQTFTITIAAADGTNSISCTLQVTVYDPIGANGFSAANITCISQSGNFTGCPAGATHTTNGTFAALNANLANKMVLFRCGDTFTGDNETISGNKWSVGAYGGCEGTQTNRPILSDAAGTNYEINVGTVGTGVTDGRISDIDCESSGNTASCIQTQTFVPVESKQLTFNNIVSNNEQVYIFVTEGTEIGVIGGNQGTGAKHITLFLNSNASNCVNGSTASQCGQGAGAQYVNVNYNGVIGTHVTGCIGCGGGVEVLRISSCRICVVENNTLENASSLGGVFKMHNGNTYSSQNTWLGSYTELVEVSDNLFQGNSGGVLSDIAPQNGFAADEYLRYITVERNVYMGPTNSCCDLLLMFSGANNTLRDNAFYMNVVGGIYPQWGAGIGKRGSANSQTITANEAYNNSCYAPSSTNSGRYCILFDTSASFSTATANSFAMNNLFYITGTTSGALTVHDTGSGNTVSNNTATVTNNPAFTNGSGTFSLISDWKPTANYTGGATVPVQKDALGVAWPPTWDLGAVHH